MLLATACVMNDDADLTCHLAEPIFYIKYESC